MKTPQVSPQGTCKVLNKTLLLAIAVFFLQDGCLGEQLHKCPSWTGA